MTTSQHRKVSAVRITYDGRQLIGHYYVDDGRLHLQSEYGEGSHLLGKTHPERLVEALFRKVIDESELLHTPQPKPARRAKAAK